MPEISETYVHIALTAALSFLAFIGSGAVAIIMYFLKKRDREFDEHIRHSFARAERLTKVEAKVDGLVEDIKEIKGDVKEVSGKIDKLILRT